MAELSSSALSDRLFFFDLDPDEQKHFKEENPSIVAMWELAESLPGLPLGFRRYLYDINTWKASHLQRKCLSGAPHRERLANRFMPTAIESKKKNLCIARLYYLDLSILERFGLEYAEFHREKAQSIDSLRRHIEFPLSFLINSDPFSLYVNRQMVEKPVILCTHCDTSAMSFGSVNKFHEHFKEHGILTAYGCHRCLHLFHTREMWEQHRKETCKENSTDDPLSASLYAIACVGCGFMYVYNPQVFTGAVSGRQLGDLMRIQNCHCWDEMVMFRLVTTENEDDLLSSEVHVEPRRWTGVTYLHEKHATCRNICGIERCGVKSSSFSDHIVHTEQHCGSQRIQFQFVNFLNELVDLNPTVKNELNWRRRRARAYPKSIRKLKSEGPGERKMPGGALHAFTVSFDPNPVLPGISKTFSRVSLCRQCQTLTIGSEPALSHAKYCYKDQSISPDEICYSDKYATNIWDFQHLPNDRGTCPVVKCRHRACSIHGFVVHMLTKHGVQVTQNLSLLKKYEEDDREDYMLSRPCLKSMEINQKCLLTYDGHFPIEGNTWSKVDYTPEDLFCKEDGAVDLSVAVTIQEIGDKEETLAIDKNVYKSKPVEEERVPNQPPTSREPIVLKIDRHLLGASYLRKDSTSRPRPSVVPDQIPIKKKKRTEEERQKRKRDKNLVANIEAMPRAETDRGPSEEIRAAQKAECDEAIKRHRQDPIPYNFKRQCFDCGLIMKDEASLQNHLKEHNPMDLNPLNFSCPFCDVKLDDMPSYYEHMYRIHSKPNFDLTKTVSPICCSLCENGRNYETLVPHLRFECTYAKNCGICKYKLHEMKDGKVQLFKSSQRDKHMKKHQEHFKRFACLCGQDFPHFVLYANHVCEKKEEKKIVTIRLSLKLFQNIVSPDEVVKWIIKQRSASRPSTSATNENAAQAVTTKGSSERLIEKSTALNGLTSFTEPTLKRRREESTFRMPERPSPSVTVLDMNPPSVVCLNPPPSIICLDQPDPYGPIPPTNQNVTNREIIGADEISLGPSSSKDDDDIVFCEAVANSKLSTAKSVAEEDDEIMICEPSEPIKKQAREKNHKCAYCSQSFYTERSLELHKKFSHEEDVSTTTKRIFGTYGIPVGRDLFFCPNCMYAFENPTTHLDHMAGHIKGIVICDYCSGTSGSRQMMIKHLSTSGHGLAPASIDPERETDTTVLPIPGEFWCTECSPSLVFATDSSLFLHLIMDHGQQLFYFCKKCLFGNTNMSHVLQHIQMGICGIERQIYERNLGCVLAKSLHFHPEDEDQHKRYLSLEENRNKFMTPNDCPRRGTIRFSTRMSTCHEVHEDGQKCFNPMNFFHYENHLIQVNNYYVAESACLPDRLLPRRVYVDPKWNLFKWIEKKNNLGPKQISIDKWPDTTAKHYPRPGNQVPIGAHTLIFHKPNVMVAAALPQPRVQFQQQLNIMAHPHPYINSQQMMTEQQVRILHHLAQQQRYQQQQAQEQGQPSTEMIQQQAPQQSHLQAMLAQNGRGAWQGPPPGGMVRMNPPPGYQHHAQQGPMMQQVAQPNMRPGQMMQQQNQYAGMPQQALSGQCQPRQHPQSAAQDPQPQQPNAARPPQSRQQSVHIQPSTSQAQEPHQSVQQVQTTPDGVPLQPVIDREVSTCAVCNKVTPNCLLVGLLKLKARQECINSVLVTTPQALPLQEKKDISLRLKSLNSVCFKHVNPWGVQIVAGKFCTQEPKALSYVFADSFSPALKSQFYDILLNAEIYKLRRNEIDLATFLKRLRAGTQCNMESCQTILKTSVEAHLHSFHSRLEDDNRTIHLCAICKKEYRTEEDMLHHIMLNHALSRRGQDVPFELMCPVCGVISPSTDFLETHLLQQHSMFSSSCRCVFANLAAKGQHERKHHSAQSSRCCLLCGECDVFEPFKCKSLVVTHAHVHGLDCKYTCRVCFESAESHSQLAEHCRQVHRIDVRCELCNVNLSADQRADHVALRHELRLYNLRHEFKVTTPPDMREVLGLS